MDIDEICAKLKLLPHPEGGFYSETYRAAELISQSGLPSRYTGDRAHSTAIYFLLTADSCSRLHRVKSDEVFHFYLGDPVLLLELLPDGSTVRTLLGTNLSDGQVPQHIVRSGTWQGSFVMPSGRFALLGTTVAPGFDFADFEMADRAKLLAQYPNEAELVEKLTKG